MRQAVGQALGLCLALLMGSGTVLAKAELEVQAGWNGAYRAGKWTAVYITAWDTSANPAKNVVLEILTPHDASFSLRIAQRLTIGPNPETFVVYMPLSGDLSDTVAVLREGTRRLAEVAFDRISTTGRSPPGYSIYSSSNELLIGCSGQRGQVGPPGGAFSWKAGARAPTMSSSNSNEQVDIRAGWLAPQMLPDAWVGYDGLDILSLHAPDLVNLPQRQQEAIAQWVRGGGRLLIWPGDGLLPLDSAIVKLLPCTVGSSEAVELSLADTKALGVPSRIEKLPGRKLEGTAAATKVQWLDGRITAYVGRSGYGLVAVMPIDTTPLAFEGNKSADFWRPVLRELMKPSPQLPAEVNSYPYGSQSSRPEEQLRSSAMQVVVDRLGDVPGVGRFDFSYIAIVLGAMMIVVGPVDWLVLKRLGKQPWTWATISGWIGLVTVGAIYIGHVVHSGDLHYRTLRLVDQADDGVAAVLDVVGIYSPRTQSYALDMPRESWCVPADISSTDGYSRASYRPGSELTLVEDAHGLLPEPMTINIWNLGFMQIDQGDSRGQKPLIKADLRRQVNANGWDLSLVGTVTNMSDSRLGQVVVRTSFLPHQSQSPKWRLAKLPAIEPGQTVSINVPLEASAAAFSPSPAGRSPQPTNQTPWDSQSWRWMGDAEMSFLVAAGNLAPQRSRQIENLLAEHDDIACIYAEAESSGSPIMLGKTTEPAIEKHWEVIRALVDLKKEEQR